VQFADKASTAAPPPLAVLTATFSAFALHGTLITPGTAASA
jgi:hypothetical protein